MRACSTATLHVLRGSVVSGLLTRFLPNVLCLPSVLELIEQQTVLLASVAEEDPLPEAIRQGSNAVWGFGIEHEKQHLLT